MKCMMDSWPGRTPDLVLGFLGCFRDFLRLGLLPTEVCLGPHLLVGVQDGGVPGAMCMLGLWWWLSLIIKKSLRLAFCLRALIIGLPVAVVGT